MVGGALQYCGRMMLTMSSGVQELGKLTVIAA
jgi:hypothetical protein